MFTKNFSFVIVILKIIKPDVNYEEVFFLPRC